MFIRSKTYLFFLSLVILISFSWSFITWDLVYTSSSLSNGIGFGLSLDYRIQNFLLSSYPKLFNVFNIFLFPVLGFVLSYLIFKKYLTQIWSIFLALIFFSNIYGVPFHEFIFSIDNFFDFNDGRELIKYSTISVILSLICVNLILSPSFIYKNDNYLLFFTTLTLVYFNVMDAMAVSLIYCFSILLNFIKRRLILKEAIMIIILILAWLINFHFGAIPDEIITDAKNTFNYTSLYFFLPICITFFSFFIFKVDSYQLLRRFSVLAIVMASEILILIIHQFEIFKFSILELQFLSIYNIFHILYFVPFISWICNSRNLMINDKDINNFKSISSYKAVTTYIPLVGIILSMSFNIKLILVGQNML